MHPLHPDPVGRFRSDLESLHCAADRFGVAVSGGPDSVALLLLAQAAFPGRVEAATVDHRLRPESRSEAAMVADLCRRMGIPHATLEVQVDRSRASLQRSAREARYRALDLWLSERGIRFLLTAHHADDQAETLVMRLLRGAGVGGLAGVRSRGRLPVPGSAAIVLRPLLGWRKRELRSLVERAGIVPAEDPGNRDDRHDRVRIRTRLESTLWLDPVPLARSAAALGDADEALAWVADRLWEKRVEEHGDSLLIDGADLPAELKRRLVLAALSRIGRPDPPPRGEEVSRLIARLDQGATATLAGVKCSSGERWRFERESERKTR